MSIERGHALKEMAIWGVQWSERPVVAAWRDEGNEVIVTATARLSGDRFICDGLTLEEAKALAKLLNAGEQHGK